MDYDTGPDLRNSGPASQFKPLPAEELDTEFKRRYPPDPLGKEIEEGARVWKVYRDEATAHDKAMLEGWNNTLNILLIFAGLFSAVATAFVVDSYKLLQSGNDDNAIMLLYAILASNNSEALGLAPPPSNLGSIPFTPPKSPRWINGLWFTSLVLSLAVALLSILVKQWLDEYTAHTTASAKNPQQWARRRAFYFEGIQTWHVSAFISVLPLLLHIALFLFFGGLVLLLWDLDRAVSLWLLVLSGIVLFFYTWANVVPFVRENCPTATPLVRQLRQLWTQIRILGVSMSIVVLSIDTVGASFVSAAHDPHVLSILARPSRHRGIVPRVKSYLQKLRRLLRNAYSAYATKARGFSALFRATDRQALKAELVESVAVLRARAGRSPLHEMSLSLRDDLDSKVLRWLMLSVSDSDAVAVSFQALGAVEPFSPLAGLMRTNDVRNIASFDVAVTSSLSTVCGPSETTRVIRSLVFLGNLDYPTDLTSESSFFQAEHPDIALLLWCWDPDADVVPTITPARDWLAAAGPSLTSTAVLVLHLEELLHELSLSQLLRILLCVRFFELSDGDRHGISRVLYHASRTACPLHRDSACNFLCFTELFAYLMLHHDALELSADDTLVLADLVGRVMMIPPPDVQFSIIPQLVEFVASELFLFHFTNTNATRIVRLLSTLQIAMVNLLPECAVPSHLHHALTNILHVATTMADTTQDAAVGSMVAKVYTLWLARTYKPGEHPKRTTVTSVSDTSLLIILLQSLLQRSDSSVAPSAWQMIRVLTDDYLPHRFLHLVDVIAAALCSLMRVQGELTELVDAFLMPVELAKLLRYAERAAAEAARFSMQDDTAAVFTNLIQHCIELRPQCWSALLDDVLTEGDRDLMAFALQIGMTVSQRGPCADCPNVPLGSWGVVSPCI